MQQSQRNESVRTILGLLSPKGRANRRKFWVLGFAVTIAFWALFALLEQLFGAGSAVTLLLYPPFFWAAFVLSARRFHDMDKPVWWLLLILIPLIGPILVAVALGFLRGTAGANRYGPDPSVRPDYMVVG